MNGASKKIRKNGGFTVAEAVVSMALVVLLTAAFLAACAAAVNLQKRSAAATQARTAAAEFVAAYNGVSVGAGSADFTDAFHEQLSFAFGIAVEFTGESGEFASGARSLKIEAAQGVIRYEYKEGAAGVQAELRGNGLVAAGYVEGYSEAVCRYVCGESEA